MTHREFRFLPRKPRKVLMLGIYQIRPFVQVVLKKREVFYFEPGDKRNQAVGQGEHEILRDVDSKFRL